MRGRRRGRSAGENSSLAAGQTRLRRSPFSSSSTYTRPVSPSRCTSRASAGASSLQQEEAVVVGADAADHGGAVAQARQGVDGVGRLAAAGADGLDVREGFVHRLAHRGRP